MKNEKLATIRENLLLEELEKLYHSNSLVKNAGLFESMGGRAASHWLKDFTKQNLKDTPSVKSDPTEDDSEKPEEESDDLFKKFIELISSGVIFRMNPFLGMFYIILSKIGFSISDVATKAATLLKPKIEKREPISSDEIEKAVSSVTGVSTDSSQVSDFNNSTKISHANNTIVQDVFEFLIKEAVLIKEEDNLIKEARYYGGSPKIPFLFPDKTYERGMSGTKKIFSRVFGNLFKTPHGPGKLRWIGTGLVVWILKTMLAGLVLHTVADVLIPDKYKSEKKQEDSKSSDSLQPGDEPSSSADSKKEQKSKDDKPKDKKLIWLVPRTGDGSIEDTLINWALNLYPKLEQYPDIINVIDQSPDFKALVKEIQTATSLNVGSKSNEITMPKRFITSRDVKLLKKNVVDEFINDDFKRKLNAPTT